MKEPLYLTIKNHYKTMIEKGYLKANDAIPSVRDIAQFFSVNPNTVQRALSSLVDEGYLLSIPKKGFFVISKNGKNIDKLRICIDELLAFGYEIADIKKYLDTKEDENDQN